MKSQYLSENDLSALIVAIHQMSQNTLPVIMVGAGLPKLLVWQAKLSLMRNDFSNIAYSGEVEQPFRPT